MAIIASSLTAFTSSGRISGVGLARAKIKGCLAINLTISGFNTPPAESPKNTSALGIASSKVRASVFWAKNALSSSINSMRPSYTTPAKSVTVMFSRGMPNLTNKLRQARAAAPAPELTNLTFLMSLPTTFKPFMMAAPTQIAVPC